MKTIADGKYVGRVVDVCVTTSKAGNPMVVIEWDIDGQLRRKSYHVVANAAGTRNERTIEALRKVFTDWDGASSDWFEENYETCLKVAAQLVILNEEWNGRTMPNVKFVNPLPAGSAKPTTPPPPKRPAATPEPHGKLPEAIEPTLVDVWGAFVSLHEGEDYPTLEKTWFDLLDKTVVPRKDQDQFDAFDWQTVIAALREEAKAAEGKEAL